MTHRRFVYHTGKFLIIISLICLTIGLPAYAWVVRSDLEAFNKQVGWANIWAAAIGGAGLLLMAIERSRTDDATRLRQNLFAIAKVQRASQGHELARLLGTDALESRSAKLRFSAADPRTGKARRGTQAGGNVDEIADYFSRLKTGRMLVLGPPGAGKTVLGMTLLLQLTDRLLANETSTVQLPVMFSMTAWSRQQDVHEWLADQISLRFQVKRRTALALLQERMILPMLDGLDEMDNEEDDPTRAELAVAKLNDFIAAHSADGLVVLGRSGSKYYSRLRSKFRNVDAILIRPLTITDVDGYLAEHCGLERARAIKSELSELPNGVRARFYSDTSTPWRLAMTAAYVNQGGDVAKLLPRLSENQSDFVARRNVELYETFLESRLQFYARGNQKGQKVARRRLSAIAHFSRRGTDGEYGSDIVLHEWWRRFGRVRVTAWQSRFGVMAALLPFSIPLDLASAETEPRSTGTWLDWGTPLVNFLMLVVIAIWTPVRASSRPLRVSFAVLLAPAKWPRLVAIVILSAGVAYMFSTFAGVLLAVTTGIGSLLLFTVVLVLLSDATEDATTPQSPVRRDFIGCFLVGLGFGFFCGSYLTELLGVDFGVRMGLGYLFVALIVFSSGRYFVATLLGRSVGLPIRISAYLKWANSAGLLRVSGLSYQFRHRELLDYLVNSSRPPSQAPYPGIFGIPVQRAPKWIRAHEKS